MLLLALLLFPGTVSAQHELEIGGIPPEAPFAVEAWVDASRLVVDLKLESGWHTYSRDVGGGAPISIKITQAGGARAIGKLHLPSDNEGKLHGRVRIEQWIQGKAGDSISAKVKFMVCDPLRCLPPIELSLHGKISPLRVLLVTSSRDEYAKRVTTFLEERNLAVTATTYEEVDAQTCSGHDVILAASRLFDDERESLEGVARFPKTKTPIVAVGFLGTHPDGLDRRGLNPSKFSCSRQAAANVNSNP